ncbi:tryptase-2-like [Astatotilapia calliptera]|uniref:tryptase-2-like n=1 Tax=Astatotilapia calliptera TaxID=8154 RepID=UPI000E4225DC|nr:tryptase-2-like [Astatotilapia calliptera]
MTGSNIALLELFESVSFNNYIQPVCLDISDSKSFPIGSQCLVTGWENKNNSRDQICTHTMDLQEGGQGSPLLCKSESSWFQVAVVTVCESRLSHGDVDVFTKISRFGSFLKGDY